MRIISQLIILICVTHSPTGYSKALFPHSFPMDQILAVAIGEGAASKTLYLTATNLTLVNLLQDIHEGSHSSKIRVAIIRKGVSTAKIFFISKGDRDLLKVYFSGFHKTLKWGICFDENQKLYFSANGMKFQIKEGLPEHKFWSKYFTNPLPFIFSHYESLALKPLF